VRKVERIDPVAVDALRLRDALARALSGGPAVALAALPHEKVGEDVALLIETGGSTGTPKIVALSASAMKASARLSNQALGATKGDCWSLSLPLNHIAGVNQLLRSIDNDSDPLVKGAEFISIVPTQLYRALRARGEQFELLANAKKVLIGGAAVPAQLLQEAASAGIPLVTSYGMTEMCGGCIYDGRALPGVEVKFINGKTVALKGPMQAEGYFDDDYGTETSFVDGWFITSDEGELSSDGKLVVHGRSDDVIISGGEKLSPNRVADLLRENFPTSEILVMGVPDKEWGESLRVIMTISNDHHGPMLPQIRELVAQGISKVAAPRSLLLLSELPVKANGKIDHQFLANAKATEEI
jgi:O-succinylbenzoic acid--CoA ligase